MAEMTLRDVAAEVLATLDGLAEGSGNMEWLASCRYRLREAIRQAGGECEHAVESVVGDPAKADIYTRPECVFHYCPDPDDCRRADRCGSPMKP